MHLLFDAGNTFLKCGVYDQRVCSFVSLSTHRLKEQLSDYLTAVTKDYALSPSKTLCFLVSVNPPVTETVKSLLTEKGFLVKQFSKELEIGFQTLYASPTLGDDRIVTDFGAFSLYGGSLIVVDLGTAATFDLLNQDGLHLGGAIMPGKEVYQTALQKSAKALPRVDMKTLPPPLGDATVSNLEAGLYYGFVGSVLHMIEVYRSLPDFAHYKVVLTGGDTELFAHCPAIDILDRELTLKGLAQIFMKGNLSQ